MHIKRYTIASFIFIILVGWYIFAYITQDTISLNFFGVQLPSLSIAMWVSVPLVLLYIASVVHISFYSMLGNLKLRKYEKDYEKFIDSIVDAFLGKENRKHSFKTERYSFLNSLLNNVSVVPKEALKSDTSNEKINSVISLVNDVKNGNVVDLKKYSLSLDNEIVIQNERNKYKKGDISAEDILGHSNKYAPSLCEEVYAEYVKTASLNMIEKHKRLLTKTALFEILNRVNRKEDGLEIINDVLIELFNSLKLEKEDFLKIASILSKCMVPEQRIKLFEIIGEANEKAMDSYLLTLFDLEILSPADEILENSQPDEFLNFKAYRALKECNKNFNINLFV
jgi:uncharacterized protein YqgQ